MTDARGGACSRLSHDRGERPLKGMRIAAAGPLACILDASQVDGG